MIFSEPVIEQGFSIVGLKSNDKTFSWWSIYYWHLLLTYYACNKLLIWIIWWAPFYLCWFSFHNEWILHCIARLVWNSQKFIFGTSDKETLRMPITMSDFFTMLWNARNFSLTFPVVENEWALLWTNTKNRMSVRPSNPRSFILVWSKFDVLELS